MYRYPFLTTELDLNDLFRFANGSVSISHKDFGTRFLLHINLHNHYVNCTALKTDVAEFIFGVEHEA